MDIPEKRRLETEARRPEFEITDPEASAVHYIEHGYPSSLVRWHHHNEYELHFITETSGRVFIGDYIGNFYPGNLILTGPRLPHNWISSIEPGEEFALRDMALHFHHATMEKAAALLPELRDFLPVLERARRGIEFFGMGECAKGYMSAIRDSSGPARFGHFCLFAHALAECRDYRLLSNEDFESEADEAVIDKVNRVTNYVLERYRERIDLGDVAALLGMNETYFSRFFRKSTGYTFSEFLTRIRIARACELLANSEQQITGICYEVGYNNVANFNRRFLASKQMTPREYRALVRERFTRGGQAVEGAGAETPG